jgi:hypothetical protein
LFDADRRFDDAGNLAATRYAWFVPTISLTVDVDRADRRAEGRRLAAATDAAGSGEGVAWPVGWAHPPIANVQLDDAVSAAFASASTAIVPPPPATLRQENRPTSLEKPSAPLSIRRAPAASG